VILENMEIEPNDFRKQIEEMFEQMANAKSKDAQQINTSLDKFLQGLQGVIFAPGQQPDYSDAFEHKGPSIPGAGGPQEIGKRGGSKKRSE
jgi:hypothetical protein